MEDESQKKWKAFISGDDDAFGWIYSTYVKRLFQYGTCLCTDKESVKDCIQSLFTDLFRNRTRVDRLQNVKVYLFSALKHNLVKAIRRKSMVEDLTEDMPFLLALSTEEQFIADEKYCREKEEVAQLLTLLTPRQKEIIYFRFIQEMSMEDICSIMKMNYQSAQNLIQRSLRKLRERRSSLSILFVLFLC